MLRSIEEGYEIEPIVHASFNLFKDMRNQLVHGLTASDKYDIQTLGGKTRPSPSCLSSKPFHAL
jgi:hypothetical protein